MADKRTTTQAPASGAPRPLAIDEGHILRAQRGDRIATAVLTGIACFVMVFPPEVLGVGGGISREGEAVMAPAALPISCSTPSTCLSSRC